MTYEMQITYIIFFGLLMFASFITFASFSGMISVHQSDLDERLGTFARDNQVAIAKEHTGAPPKRVRRAQNTLHKLGAPLPGKDGRVPPSTFTNSDIESFDATFDALITSLTGNVPFIRRFLERQRQSLYDASLTILSTTTIDPANPVPGVRTCWRRLAAKKARYGFLGGLAVIPGVVVNIFRIGGGWLSGMALLLAGVFLLRVSFSYVRNPQAEWQLLLDDVGVAITISSILALPAALLTMFGAAIMAAYKKAHSYGSARGLWIFLLIAPVITLLLLSVVTAINLAPTIGPERSDLAVLFIVILIFPLFWCVHIFRSDRDNRYSWEMQTASIIGATVILALTALVFWLYLDAMGEALVRQDAVETGLWFMVICSASTSPFFMLYHLAGSKKASRFVDDATA